MALNLNLANLLPIQGFNVTGVGGSLTGYSVSNAGDVNRDGYDDVIIGAPWYNSDAGIAYLIFGSNSLTNINLASLGTQGITITGAGPDYGVGYYVSMAGDVNGDGYDDVIIGAPYYDSDTGIAYLIFGSNSLTNISLASLGTQGINITGPGNYFTGGSVSAAGDINGDDYDDFLIGAPYYDSNTGIAYLIYGNNNLTDINLTSLGIQGISLTGAGTGNYTGYSVSAAGDVNGDGYDDFLISSPYYETNTGIAYLIYGSNNLTNINLASLGTQGITIDSPGINYDTGFSVSTAGDVNSDGYDDIIIGAPGYSSSTGIVYLIYGSNSLTNVSLASLGTQGINITGAGNYFTGCSVSVAGDVNNDGFDDVIIGAPYYESSTGIVYLIYGSNNLTNINLASLSDQGIIITGAGVDYDTGFAVRGAGDVNNDGFDDIIIGAYGVNADSGASYIIYGAASGFVTSSPTSFPTSTPTGQPSIYPFALPTTKPTEQPTSQPTISPTISPSSYPSTSPTNYPTNYPTSQPSISPSSEPTNSPTNQPSNQPSLNPTEGPSAQPSSTPSLDPSSEPTSVPSSVPTNFPSATPSGLPSSQPFADPTSYPTSLPTLKPSKAYELVLNYNVQTAIYSTIASLAGGVMLYLAPSFILKNWGYKFKYVYNEQERESLQPHEIGLYKKEDQLFALHKEKDEIAEYLLEANHRDINDISLKLHQFIWEQLENNPEFKRNPSNSQYKYIYNDVEANNLRENEIGLKFTGKLPLLSCNIFCNSEQLIAYKFVGDHLINIPIKIANEDNGISETLYHAIASEHVSLSNNIFTTLEETQIRDFLLVPGKLKPSISVFQKIFCLYTPIYKDLGSAPGFIHNMLNCNGHGPELLYRLITLDGYIPGFIYGLCYTFLKKYQVGLNPRISDDSFAKIAIYLDSHLKSEVSSQTITNPINQEKKDDLERGKIGSDIDSSSFEQASSSVDMFDRIKKPTSTCVIQAVYEIEFDNPIINEVYQNGLGLSALKPLAFSKEETDVKQITQLGNSESYKSDKSSFNEPDMNYPNHIIGTFINARQVIEYIPIMKYVSQNIIYPLIENHLPESAKNISLPEILDSKVFLFTAHLSLGSIGAMLLPQETINKGLIASTAASTAYGIRLASSNYLAAQKQEVFSNNKPMDAFEITKYCMSTILSYTVPALAICALAKMIMPSYQCSELDLGTKLSFAEAECYSVYKATQIPTFSTTADIVIPYITDAIVAAASYANGYGPMAIVASVVTADWMSRLAMDMVTDEIKENYVDHTLDYILKTYSCVYETINHIIGITQEF